MSDEKHETIEYIVREMRTLGRLDEKSTDKIPRSLQALGLRNRQILVLMRERKEATCKESSHVGNAAKMREALDMLLGLFDSGLVEYSDSCDTSDTAQIQYVIDKAEAALSVPLRNCDAFLKEKVLEMLEDRSFSKEDTIEWLYAEAKGE